MGSRRQAPARSETLFDLEPDPKTLPRFSRFARVALNVPVACEFTYGIPEPLQAAVAPGGRVAVPFGPHRQIGVVVDVVGETDVPAAKLRALSDVLDEEPVVDRALLELTRWIADRYLCSWGEALSAVLPAPLKHERGSRKVLVIEAAPGVGTAELDALETRFTRQHRLLRTLLELDGPIPLLDLLRSLQLSDSPARSLERRGWARIESVTADAELLMAGSVTRERPETLSGAQERAVRAVSAALSAGEARTFLLHGVTGSGKTEVYLRTIEHALSLGRTAIVLVPEIALTPQTVGWFRARFGDVAVLHSRMTDAQRFTMWMRLKRGDLKVVVGARSAIFAPLASVGVIVVDEEHEPSFKQASVPRYHARDAAMERARRAGAVCILGSATPSLESWYAARRGAVELLPLPERVGGGSQPTVHVVDMRLEHERARDLPLFSRLLRSYLAETIDAREQAILFLNRRGFVPVLWCAGCKLTVRCDQCDMSLTYHRRIRRLVCHGCCEERMPPAACPTCSRPGLSPLGVGSERVESELRASFPGLRVQRMDSDTMRRREDYENALERFGRHQIDVLVGTQMIAKGLDFPRVTLVGIISADQALHLPDFRAAERTFQLIAQVAGRAGRADLAGRIVVQSVAPEHPAVRLGARSRYAEFVEQERLWRAEAGYPPHGRLLRVLYEDTDEPRLDARVQQDAERLRAHLEGADTLVLGPAAAPVSLLRGRFRKHMLLKGPEDASFDEARDLLVDIAQSSAPKVTLDVDPMGML